MRTLRVLFTLLALSVGLLAAESPFNGTWKLNVAKSKLPPPAMKSETAYIVADDNNFQMKDEFVDDKGQPLTVTYNAKFDGKDYPVTGDPNSDSISFQRVDANTLKVSGTMVKLAPWLFEMSTAPQQVTFQSPPAPQHPRPRRE